MQIMLYCQQLIKHCMFSAYLVPPSRFPSHSPWYFACHIYVCIKNNGNVNRVSSRNLRHMTDFMQQCECTKQAKQNNNGLDRIYWRSVGRKARRWTNKAFYCDVISFVSIPMLLRCRFRCGARSLVIYLPLFISLSASALRQHLWRRYLNNKRQQRFLRTLNGDSSIVLRRNY